MLIHTVHRGESLWQLAKEYQISLDALVAANPQIADPNYILPGSKINIPNPLAEASKPTLKAEPAFKEPEEPKTTDKYYDHNGRPLIYTTQGGETLYSISAQFHLPIAQLHYHNYHYAQNRPLPAGERIIVPADAAVQIKVQA